jgi:WD40 repeat protein
MAEVARAAGPPAPEDRKPPEYDAFLSYAHRDRQVTVAIQKGLHQIGRRIGQLRALRVFRDDTNLAANPDLWGKIAEALDNSRYMIVVLSPQSAASHWVNEEISYWLQCRGHEQLMLVLAEGHLGWDATSKSFDPDASDAAPPVLVAPGSLPSEPLYIDVSEDAPWDLRSLAFRDKVTALAAPIHGKAKDQLTGDDLREQRRSRRLRAAAISGLVVLTVVAVVAAVIAVAQRQEAVRRLHDAVVAKLNAEGVSILGGTTPGGDARAVQELLAANAIEADGVPILNAQIARFTTQRIIDTSSMPHHLAYSPDGRRIATTHEDGTVRQWDSATGKPVGATPLKGQAGKVAAVAYTPDGHTLASAGIDGIMQLWNADTGAALNPKPQHVEALQAIAANPNGKTLLTAAANDAIQAWDPHNGQLRWNEQVFTNTNASLTDVTYDRDGNLFAVASLDGGIGIYDTDPVKPHAPMIMVSRGDSSLEPVFRIAFSPDGHTVAAASNDLQLWNADTGTLIRKIKVQAKTNGVFLNTNAVAFSPDGHRIATGRLDGAVQLWDPDTGAQVGQTLIGHTGMVLDLAFSPDGHQIATVSLDGTLRLWSANIGQPMQGPDSFLGQVAFSPDGQRVAVIGPTAVQQWDVASGQPRSPMPGGERFSWADGGRIVTVTGDGTMQVWDANTGQPAKPPIHLNLPQQPLSSIDFAFSADGREVATGVEDKGTIQLWDVATGHARGQAMTVDTDTGVEAFAFSPDGHRLVASYGDGVRLWNTDTTQLDATITTEFGNPIPTVALSRDGTTVAGGTAGSTVDLWDLATRKQLPDSPLQGHHAIVSSVALGLTHQLASGGSDATLRLWDTSTGIPTAAPVATSAGVTSVAISPDGRLAASATEDGTLLLSPAIADPAQLCDKLSANMSRKQWRDWVSPAIPYITVCPGLPIAHD